VNLEFLGVRGSMPVSGPQFARFGGHTSCVAVTRDGDARPTLILDAGTGISGLSSRFEGTAFIGTILLTHLHWDHVQGLPFFAAADRAAARVTVGMPAQGDPRQLLERAMSPPHFPIGPDGLLGTWNFEAVEPGDHDIEGFAVTALEIPHKGGRTFGYRVSDGNRTFAYLPDHAPRGLEASAAGRAAALALADHVDVLIHGGQFVSAERVIADNYGHATVDDAIELATAAGARRLVLTHHGPTRADDAIEAVVRASSSGFARPLMAAREGCVVEL
jgi:phosphoribosyl 1,2-cyclic phosphodiesterase